MSEVQHIAIDTEDGMAVMLYQKASDAEIVAEMERAGFTGRKWARISPEDIPADRANRALWRLRDGKIVVESL